MTGNRTTYLATQFAAKHAFVFVGGLHRSGTTLLTHCIGEHPEASCFQNTNVSEDEGQHLQNVYPPAIRIGGPGSFGFSREAHLTEKSRLVRRDTRARLLDAWKPFWDCSKQVLVEKSPPNLIRARFLQAIFPDARFVMIVRHPIAVTEATQKWSKTSLLSMLDHWVICHQYFLQDVSELRHVLLIQYEELVSNPAPVLERVFNFLGLRPINFLAEIREGLNDRYFDQWETSQRNSQICDRLAEIEPYANAFGYSVISPRRTMPLSETVTGLLRGKVMSDPLLSCEPLAS
ncbi:MAG: sulfotransferase [Candidatus Sulfotelmatobacter sp.]